LKIIPYNTGAKIQRFYEKGDKKVYGSPILYANGTAKKEE